MKYFSLLLLSMIMACSNGGHDNGGFSKSESTALDLAYEEVNELEEVVIEEVNSVEQNQQVQGQKIIKTAQLRFEAPKPEETHQRILELAQSFDAYVQNDNSGKRYNQIYRNMVVRVPTKNFQLFIDGVSKGVEYFDQKDVSRKDVTEEFVDLEARLKAKRELEKRYLELLGQANNVKEMLEIERELATIREEIEAKQGRLQYLQSQVSLSTVYIEFYKQTSNTGVTISYGQKMLNALKGGWDGISVFFIGILYLWPLFVVALIIILLIRRYLQKSRQKHAEK